MTCDTRESAIDAKIESSEGGSTSYGRPMKPLAGLKFVFLIWENTAIDTDLISKVFVIQLIVTTSGYFKRMSCTTSLVCRAEED